MEHYLPPKIEEDAPLDYMSDEEEEDDHHQEEEEGEQPMKFY